MKLLFFDDRHYATQGAQRILVQLASFAHADGHDVTVASTKEGDLLALAREHGLATLALGTPARLDQWGGLLSGSTASRLRLVAPFIGQNLAVARRVRRERYDVVWAAAMRPMLSLLATSWTTRATVVWHVMSDGYFPWFNELAGLAADRIVLIADALAPTVGRLHRTRGTRRRTTTLRVGVPSPPADGRGDRAALARTLGLDDRALGKTWIMSIGAVVPEKGHLDLIRAVNAMNDRARDQTVLIVAGPLSNTGHAEEVRREAMAGRVETVVHGWVEDTDAWMRTADIFALASSREGMPLVLIEAIQRGAVPVAYDVGAVSELIEDGRTGRLLAPGAVDGLASALQELVLTPDRREDLVSHAQRSVEARYTPAAMRRTFEEILKQAHRPERADR